MLALSLEVSPKMSSSTPDTRAFLTGCYQAASRTVFYDTSSSSMTWEGARCLSVVKPPSPADHDDRVSSSTASARLLLRRVVKHRCHGCNMTLCRRACFFVAYDDSDVYVSTRHGWEPNA